jgi:hypothetical protein
LRRTQAGKTRENCVWVMLLYTSSWMAAKISRCSQ